MNVRFNTGPVEDIVISITIMIMKELDKFEKEFPSTYLSFLIKIFENLYNKY